MEQGCSRTVARQVHFDELFYRGPRAIAHEHYAIGQQNRLVDVMRDHEYGLLRGLDDRQQFVLYGAPGQGIERTEGFIQQEHLRLDRKGACNTHALLHAAGQF